MIKLFKYENYDVIIDPEAILLVPFKKLYDRDRTKNKTKATMELAYIYYFCDPRSDYQYITSPTKRLEEIKKGLGIPKDWTPDKFVNEAMDYYNSFKPISAGLLEDTKNLVTKFRKSLNDMDFNATDDKGKPINTLNTIAKTIAEIPNLIVELDKAEKALMTDITNDSKARGTQTKALFEDDN